MYFVLPLLSDHVICCILLNIRKIEDDNQLKILLILFHHVLYVKFHLKEITCVYQLFFANIYLTFLYYN